MASEKATILSALACTKEVCLLNKSVIDRIYDMLVNCYSEVPEYVPYS